MYHFSYPVEVKIEVKAVPKLEFPSVTLCNLNPLKRDHMHEGPFAYLHEYFELDDTDSLYDDYWKEAREHLEGGTVTRYFKTFFVLNSDEHEIYPDHKC